MFLDTIASFRPILFKKIDCDIDNIDNIVSIVIIVNIINIVNIVSIVNIGNIGNIDNIGKGAAKWQTPAPPFGNFALF